MRPWHEQKVDLATKALIGWILGLSFCLIQRWFHRRKFQLVNLQLKDPQSTTDFNKKSLKQKRNMARMCNKMFPSPHEGLNLTFPREFISNLIP